MYVQVAMEIATDLCTEMGVMDPMEVKEFSIKATRGQGADTDTINSPVILMSFGHSPQL